MNKSYCLKCGKCCKNIMVDFDRKILYRDGIQELTPELEGCLEIICKNKLWSLCSCKYLENNLCVHPEKPIECVKFPNSPFAKIPDGCGYYGENFMKLETVKQKIRKIKEEIIYYQTELVLSKNKNEKSHIQKILKNLDSFVRKYQQYGSYDW